MYNTKKDKCFSESFLFIIIKNIHTQYFSLQQTYGTTIHCNISVLHVEQVNEHECVNNRVSV